jgi:hypothetical protein
MGFLLIKLETFSFPQNVQTGAEPTSLLLKGHRDMCRRGQVASVQLDTCFSLVSKLRISGAVPQSPTPPWRAEGQLHVHI